MFSQICQYLRNIVAGSSELQYTIERCFACVDEGPLVASLSSHEQRLRHLERWRDASRHERHLQKVEERHETAPGIYWGAHGSVIWRHDCWAKTVDFTVLPSSSSSRIGRMRWGITYHQAFRVTDVRYDSENDLLVLQLNECVP